MDGKPSEEIELFKREIEKSLIVINELYTENDENFELFYKNLLDLAQVGIVGNQLNVAKQALISLQEEINVKEGGKIKNKYMKSLGIAALKVGILPLLIALFLQYRDSVNTDIVIFKNFCFLWSSSMLGVWLSFGIRKIELKFYDLHLLENDRLSPFIRLFFSGALTLVVGLVFSLGIATISIGLFSSIQINSNVRLAILIGVLCGISEKALPNKISKQAKIIIDEAEEK